MNKKAKKNKSNSNSLFCDYKKKYICKKKINKKR